MEEKKIIVQRLRKNVDDEFTLAEKYYSILSAINSLNLTHREIQLVAFTAVKGNITYANVREEFCKKYSTTSPTINNIISKLKKMGIFIKEAGKVKINPIIVVDFNKDLTLEIKLEHGETNVNVSERMDHQEDGNQDDNL
tara:strand:- start:930 stop:1349 length:420 start_codon:yes stop_codon:yes gene_type:complete